MKPEEKNNIESVLNIYFYQKYENIIGLGYPIYVDLIFNLIAFFY